MTVDEKREAIKCFCDKQDDCNSCPCDANYNPKSWCHNYNENNLPEELIDVVLNKMGILDNEKEYITLNVDVSKELHEEVESDMVNHPPHYCREGGMESIDEMVLAFGKEAVKNFCLLNVWKYRYRAADKNGIEDLKKSDWYMNKYKELCNE